MSSLERVSPPIVPSTGHERGDRHDVVHETGRRIPEELREQPPVRLSLEQLLREVDDGADVVQAHEAEEGQRQDPEELLADVEVEQARPRKRQPRNPNHEHHLLLARLRARRRHGRRAGCASERQPSRQRQRERLAGRPGAPPHRGNPEAAQDEVREPACPLGTEPVRRRFRAGLGHLHARVVEEDDREPDGQPPELAFLPRVKPERDREQREHEAGHRKGELLVDVHDLGVRRFAVRDLFRPLFPEACNRHLGQPAVQAGVVGEDAPRVHLERARLRPPDREHARLFAGCVVDDIVQDDIDDEPLLVEDEATMLGGRDGNLARMARVRHEHAVPAAHRVGVPHLEDLAREAGVEHLRLDVGLGGLPQVLGRDLPELLVRVRQEVHHHVERQAAAEERQHQRRAQEPEGADAAGEQRDRLAVAREPAEGHQQTRQEGHRQRHAQGLRQEQRQEESDGADRHAFREQRFGAVEHRPDGEHEREHAEGQRERPDGLTNDVAVEGAHPGWDFDDSTTAPGFAARAARRAGGQKGASSRFAQLFLTNL